MATKNYFSEIFKEYEYNHNYNYKISKILEYNSYYNTSYQTIKYIVFPNKTI